MWVSVSVGVWGVWMGGGGVLLMIESCVVREGKLYIACRMSLAAVIVDRLVVLVSVTLLLVSQSVRSVCVCVCV